MAVVRATALSSYPAVVREAGGDPDQFLTRLGIEPAVAGRPDVFIPLSSAVLALQTAAELTYTPDLGRRLATRQGIEILGPVGVAARTAETVAEALRIFEKFLGAYSPGLCLRMVDLDGSGRSFIEYRILDPSVTASPQHAELALGVILQVLRHLLGDLYRPLRAHLTHEPLDTPARYLEFFGCRTEFGQLATGLTVRSADLSRPLHNDALAHRAVVDYLETVVGGEAATRASVRTLVGRILPSGKVNLEIVAGEMNLHPKTLQRRLAAEGATFAEIVDTIRRDTAHCLLRDTRITMAHLARELGYAEQTVLTRSCHRWFGEGPAAHRRRLQSGNGVSKISASVS